MLLFKALFTMLLYNLIIFEYVIRYLKIPNNVTIYICMNVYLCSIITFEYMIIFVLYFGNLNYLFVCLLNFFSKRKKNKPKI